MSTLRWSQENLDAYARRLTAVVDGAPVPAKVVEAGTPEPAPKVPKYRNTPTTDSQGVRHASKKQARRYTELGLRMKSGEIMMLAREVRFRLPGGVEYRADHVFANQKAIEVMAGLVASGDLVVEDVKSPATRADKAYRIKARQMRECLGLPVTEV